MVSRSLTPLRRISSGRNGRILPASRLFKSAHDGAVVFGWIIGIELKFQDDRALVREMQDLQYVLGESGFLVHLRSYKYRVEKPAVEERHQVPGMPPVPRVHVYRYRGGRGRIGTELNRGAGGWPGPLAEDATLLCLHP